MLVVEVDGGQHNGSIADAKRDRELMDDGYRVIRFWNNDVLNNVDGVLIALASVLEEK